MADDDARDHGGERSSRDTGKLVVIAVLVIVLIAFVIDNTRKVKVGFVFTDFTLPLIFVLVATAVLGALIDRLLQARRRRRNA
jgi:uncharacterized integral membrane protein